MRYGGISTRILLFCFLFVEGFCVFFAISEVVLALVGVLILAVVAQLHRQVVCVTLAPRGQHTDEAGVLLVEAEHITQRETGADVAVHDEDEGGLVFEDDLALLDQRRYR